MAKAKVDKNGFPLSWKGYTPYKNVYYGYVGWAGALELCYVALAPLNAEEAKIAGKKTFLFHLSKHDNPLDAAYSAMTFERDRKANIRVLANVDTGCWDHGTIPTFAYPAEDTEAMAVRRENKKNGIKKVREAKASAIKARRAGSGRPGPVATPRDIANTQVRGYASYMVDKHRLPANVKGLVMKIVTGRDFENYEIGTAFVNGVIANATRR